MSVATQSFTDQDVAAIRSLTDQHVRAVLDHNPSAFMATCTNDIVFLPPDQPSVDGPAAGQKYLEDFPTPVSFEAEIADVEGDGDLAYSRGIVIGTFPDGASTTLKWMAIHRRQPDGSWKMARDMWNTNHPAAGA